MEMDLFLLEVQRIYFTKALSNDYYSMMRIHKNKTVHKNIFKCHEYGVICENF